ncbi:MAG: TIGR02530 family flagellar biosynthesis protein [Lachnospiraceae bacterium]
MERINSYTSIDQIAGQLLNNQRVLQTESKEIDGSFAQVLNKQRSIAEILDEQNVRTLKFSKHAGNRLSERNISLTDEQMKRLEDGANKAGAKGIKESLVILDNYSFIVNTSNNTVITAMDQMTEEDHIYTNIDGAVII